MERCGNATGRIPLALAPLLGAALAACSPSAPEAPEEPVEPAAEEVAPPADLVADVAPVEPEPPVDPPAPRPASANGCEMVILPGHIENPGQLNSRYVPGPTVEVCDQQQQRLPVPGPASAPLPPATEAGPEGGRKVRLYGVA